MHLGRPQFGREERSNFTDISDRTAILVNPPERKLVKRTSVDSSKQGGGQKMRRSLAYI